jgi:NADH dehydrogenase
MRQDNVAASGLPGFKELEIEPRGVNDVIRLIEQRS